MSYDLLVFEPSAAPRDRAEFLKWWSAQSQWTEEHGYNDPSVPPLALQSWYNEITATFPNLNGPGVSDDEIGPRHTDYTLGQSLIYAGFAWTEAETAYPLVRELAVKHQVGFFDASCDEPEPEIYFPGDSLRPPSGGSWRTIAADFRSGDLSKYMPQQTAPKRRWFDLFRRKK
jgi:hypothetical protein